jgi:A/G-specific adenine glycosylase
MVLIDLGATICLRTRPACERCPVAADCVARRDGRVDALPSPRPAKLLPRRALRVLLLTYAGTLLLERRPPVGIWAGLWSLPEMPLDEDVAAHCRARFGAEVTVREPLAPIEHGFTHYHLTLHPQPVAVRRWPVRAEAPGQAWLLPDEAITAALPAPIRRLLKDVGAASQLASGARPRARPRASVRR